MKYKSVVLFLIITVYLVTLLSGCDKSFENPGDYLGGGGTVLTVPEESKSGNTEAALSAVESIEADGDVTEVPEGATEISEEKDNLSITQPGSYCLRGEINDKVEITAENVTLYLCGATLKNGKKVIESTCSLTVTLIRENYICNTNTEEAKNAIDVEGDLIINGRGSMEIESVKNGIKANSISIFGAKLTIRSTGDGLHAEAGVYDDAAVQPDPSYDDGGYVYLFGADLTVISGDDGIQADTFIYIAGNSKVDISAGGGAPAGITEVSSDNASGKGIKAGEIDWGAAEENLEWEGYLVWIESGAVTVDANDDALHSNGELRIEGGTISISSGDDAIHSDDLLQITDGTVTIDKCYEGIESAKVEISGGTIEIQSYEDGINAADGTQNMFNGSNGNCHIIISGGYISVNCIGREGDGIDSNGTILISGGELYIAGSSGSADAALDADGGILIDGGYVFATGSLGMVETPASNSSQYCVSFAASQSLSSGTTLYLCDGNGDVIMYFMVPRDCQSVIISCPEFENGSTYSIYGGDSLLTSFTISSTITVIGSEAPVRDPGGMPGGNRPGPDTPGFGGR